MNTGDERKQYKFYLHVNKKFELSIVVEDYWLHCIPLQNIAYLRSRVKENESLQSQNQSPIENFLIYYLWNQVGAWSNNATATPSNVSFLITGDGRWSSSLCCWVHMHGEHGIHGASEDKTSLALVVTVLSCGLVTSGHIFVICTFLVLIIVVKWSITINCITHSDSMIEKNIDGIVAGTVPRTILTVLGRGSRKMDFSMRDYCSPCSHLFAQEVWK